MIFVVFNMHFYLYKTLMYVIFNYAMNITKMDVQDTDITHISTQLLALMFLNLSFFIYFCVKV